MAKLNLSDIKKGDLVNKIHPATVEFVTLDEEVASVDVLLKQLPFIETESLHKQMADGDAKAYAEWIAKAVVNDKGKPEFTIEQVETLFSQSLINGIWDKLMLMEQTKKLIEAKKLTA